MLSDIQRSEAKKATEVMRKGGIILYPTDTIWGIGLGKENEKAQNIAMWRGKNLLGFALMEVRDEIRKVYQNVHLLKNRNE